MYKQILPQRKQNVPTPSSCTRSGRFRHANSTPTCSVMPFSPTPASDGPLGPVRPIPSHSTCCCDPRSVPSPATHIGHDPPRQNSYRPPNDEPPNQGRRDPPPGPPVGRLAHARLRPHRHGQLPGRRRGGDGGVALNELGSGGAAVLGLVRAGGCGGEVGVDRVEAGAGEGRVGRVGGG